MRVSFPYATLLFHATEEFHDFRRSVFVQPEPLAVRFIRPYRRFVRSTTSQHLSFSHGFHLFIVLLSSCAICKVGGKSPCSRHMRLYNHLYFFVPQIRLLIERYPSEVHHLHAFSPFSLILRFLIMLNVPFILFCMQSSPWPSHQFWLQMPM